MNFSQKIASMDLYRPASEDFPVRLDANESCFSLPESIQPEIAAAVSGVLFNRYPDPTAGEVCRLMGEYCGIPGDRFVPGNGSDELIGVILSMLPRGSRVAVCLPDFDMYRVYASICECQVVSCPRVGGLPDVEALARLGRDSDLVILSNPCNPTGQGLEREKVLSLVERLSCLCVIDEAYMDFWNQSVADSIDRYPNLIVLKTCSKNIGLAGIRLGFAIANQELAAILMSVKSPYNVNSVTQAIGSVILRKPEFLRKNTERILQAKAYLTAGLSRWASQREDCSFVDTVVNFVILQTPRAREWHRHLKKHGIAVRLCPDALRITAGLEAETDALVQALKDIKKEEIDV
ncbi:MAG: histidinol-phosphate aminotransferase family protein [Oscillospiraceae bacterium]|nr:histidinol-phosphate aminotransferase family protein [Oscillospiraceae bacterium]